MPRTYIVQSGDTLSGIVARECPGTSWQAVARDNNLRNPSAIFPGQSIVLNCAQGLDAPPPAVYVVQAGDTLAGIVNRFCPGTSYLQVAADNHINDPDRIVVGQQIQLNCAGGQPNVPGGPNRANNGSVWIDAPYHSQDGPNANRSGTDCGPACVRMMIGWNRMRQGQKDTQKPTINDIWDFVGKAPGQFTNLNDQVAAAQNWGLNLRIVNGGATIPTIKNEIDHGRPVLMLCHYGSFNNPVRSFQGGHFVVVIGFEPGFIVIHDPIGWYGARGWRLPENTFENGIGAGTALDGNPAHCGLFVN